jgi:hypothetical protein
MRNSFAYSLTAAAIVFGLALGGPTVANAQSVMRTCATEWKQAEAAGTTGGQSWPQFLAQCRTPGLGRRAIFASRSRACPSVRLSVPVVAAVSAHFRGSLQCRRPLGPPKRHEDMREPMERG